MIEYYGFNSIKNLSEILTQHNFRTVFLITGRKSFDQPEIKNIIFDQLKKVQFTHFNEFSPNPKIEDVKKGLNLFNKNNYDAVIAIGGGSVIDMGKSISILSKNKGSPEEIIEGNIPIKQKGVPLIRIPTTAGSGSEATHFAVVYIGKKKYSLANPKFMQAEFVIIDPQFLLTLPKNIINNSGMDALTQAIESFWNINSTEESRGYAKKAINLIMKNLVNASNTSKKKYLSKMALAANYAGKAINITKTTACHAISYPITSYFGVPHGHAVALTLPSMLVYNSKVSEADLSDPRGVQFVKNILNQLVSILGTSNIHNAKETLLDLMRQIGLETRLSKLGIESTQDIDLIVKNGFTPNRVKNNPRVLTEAQLRKILEDIQ